MSYVSQGTLNAGTWQKQPGGTFSKERTGLVTYRVQYRCNRGEVFSLLPNLGTVDLDHAFLYLERVEAIEEHMELATVTLLYAGTTGPAASEPPVYELSLTTATRPIETHPAFASAGSGFAQSIVAAAGGWADGKANRDSTTKVFTGFGADATGNLIGVTDYLDANQMTWSKTYLTTTQPTDISAVGKIATPDSDGSNPVPTLGTNQTWLYTGITWQKRGIIYQVTKTWRASGLAGWNTNIYLSA